MIVGDYGELKLRSEAGFIMNWRLKVVRAQDFILVRLNERNISGC